MDFPYSFQDLAKALREVVRIFDDLAKRSGHVVEFYNTRRRKVAARNLDHLRFREGGVIKRLRMIASGDFSEADIKNLKAELDGSADDVADAINTLAGFNQAIREQLSLETAVLLEDIIEGENGKRTIRDLLWNIANWPESMVNYRWDWRETLSKREQADVLQGWAIRVLHMIGVMNMNIIVLHRSLIEGKKITKRATKTQKAASRTKRSVAKA